MEKKLKFSEIENSWDNLTSIDTIVGQERIVIHNNIEFEDLVSISTFIAESCLDDDNYYAEYREILLLFHVLDKLSNLEPPKDQDNNIDIFSMHKFHISTAGQEIIAKWEQLPSVRMLIELTDEKIAYRKEQLRLDYRVMELLNKSGEILANKERLDFKMEKDFKDMLEVIETETKSYYENLDLEKQLKDSKELIKVLGELPENTRQLVNDMSKTQTGKTLDEHLQTKDKVVEFKKQLSGNENED